MKKFKQYIAEAGFSKSQINRLRAEYGKMELINPMSKAYKALDAMLEKMSIEELQMLLDAKIKFISSLALAKIVRKQYEIKNS